ncbi:Putative germ cell-less protein-like 1-like [Arachis hypogaea]|nr:Putative germ cell-less protein-like 1-like [Arachis hypogaea]
MSFEFRSVSPFSSYPKIMDPSGSYPVSGGGATQMKMTIRPSHSHHHSESSNSDRALDCNLTSLCDHIQSEGFNSGAFSDILLHALGSTFRLHRLLLSRSSYFRNMLHGPWKEASAPVVTLHVDDKNVNEEAITMALAYLYGHHPKLNDNNAFRVLAAASFLDLQDLCAICTDFIISELWTSNFLAYQVFAENQDYGIHGERVRNACWGYLCQSGGMELKEVLPKLSSQTLHALLTSDELWIPSEEKRFELALYVFLAKSAQWKAKHPEHGSSSSESGTDIHSDSEHSKGKSVSDGCTDKRLETDLEQMSLKSGLKDPNARNLLVELPDFNNAASNSNQQSEEASYTSSSNLKPTYSCNMEGPSSMGDSLSDTDGIRTSCSYVEMPVVAGANGVAMEGPSEEGSCFHLDNNSWIVRDQSRNRFSSNSSSSGVSSNDWGRYGAPFFSWGGRVVGKRRLEAHSKRNYADHGDEYDAFLNIFEGALLNVRKQLEELGFPCKAVNDGLWLQMLLSQRVQEIAADTCKSCSLMSMACTCRQPFTFSHGANSTGFYIQEHNQNNMHANMGNIYVAEPSPGEGNGIFRPVRVHVRGAIDGLAGIGRGTTFVPAAASAPTRFVFSRVPFGVGNRNYQQSAANDDSEMRTDHNGDLSGDGLTALVGLSQGGVNGINVHGELSQRGYEMDMQGRMSGTAGGPSTGGIPMQMLETPEHNGGIEWENSNNSSISLDLKTPLSHFPPFRFGVQFEDVHRLGDGQVKHSPEMFYAGSLWKVSVQAFNDEDPQGRRTLGLFLHRRKAEITDIHRKVHMYVDSREKVTARYQLICPSKREVMVFGSFKQTGTLLPKAPKGWGWRTALLFDELADLLQNGALRVIAVVQLV